MGTAPRRSRMTDSGPSTATALRAALTLIALLTAAIAAWLLFVVTVVLPDRDPARVPMWTAFAIGFAAYSPLTLLLPWPGPGPPGLARAAREHVPGARPLATPHR